MKVSLCNKLYCRECLEKFSLVKHQGSTGRKTQQRQAEAHSEHKGWGAKVRVGNGRNDRGHTIMGCIRCRGKIRFSLEWEPLTQTGGERNN